MQSKEVEPSGTKQKQPDIYIFSPGLTLLGYLERGMDLTDEQIQEITSEVRLLVGELISKYITRGKISTAPTEDLPPPSNAVR